MKTLLREISKCQVCTKYQDLGPRPVVAGHAKSKIVIIGQAPGIVVHKSGIPWDDKSGKNLRKWMDISDETFYNPKEIALLPMGFCYQGKGKSGDLAPRTECAPLWHDVFLEKMKEVQLILLIGKYSQDYYLKEKSQRNLTETVKNFKDYLLRYFVLPHPSPRNNIWQARNEWFKQEVLPELKLVVSEVLREKPS